MVDKTVDGDLDAKLQALRASGESYESISRILAVDYGVQVTGVTIREWLIILAAPNRSAEPLDAA
jgi:hypothetical protein